MKARKAASDVAIDRQRIAALCRWFRRSARDLPWRRERQRWGAWGALVAEAMLQQTQVARVAERFDQFMLRFPAPASMASATLQDVLALWQGLGYYRRARSLHAAAVMIRDEFAGDLPESVDGLLRLPGVGRYTAGAIASIIFNQPQPIVDGNVQRVLARWDAMDRLPQDRAAIDWTWRRAGTLVQMVPAQDVATFNEALMELGATVCTPRSPRCDRCPVADACIARQTGRADQIPPPRLAPTRQVIHHHAVLIERKDALLLERRPRTGMWADLWQPPALEIDRPLTTRQFRDRIPAALGLQPATLRRRASFEHQTTHRRVVFHVYVSTLKAATRTRNAPKGNRITRQWVRGDRLAALPLSAAHRRVVAHAAILACRSSEHVTLGRRCQNREAASGS